MAIVKVEVPEANITFNSATVRWETQPGEEATLDKVRYGLAGGPLDQETELIANPNNSVVHVAVITGLLDNTDYVCQPSSTIGFGELPCTAPVCTPPFKTKLRPQPGQVTGIAASTDKTEIHIGETASITLRAMGTAGSIAGKPIVPSILNGEPGQDPRGDFSPTAPSVGPDPGNTCVVAFIGRHNGRAKLQFKADTADAKIDIIVRP